MLGDVAVFRTVETYVPTKTRNKLRHGSYSDCVGNLKFLNIRDTSLFTEPGGWMSLDLDKTWMPLESYHETYENER